MYISQVSRASLDVQMQKNISGAFNFINLIVENNTAEVGGGIYLEGLDEYTPTFDAPIIQHNFAATLGGGLFFEHYDVAVRFIVFGHNHSGEGLSLMGDHL